MKFKVGDWVFTKASTKFARKVVTVGQQNGKTAYYLSPATKKDCRVHTGMPWYEDEMFHAEEHCNQQTIKSLLGIK